MIRDIFVLNLDNSSKQSVSSYSVLISKFVSAEQQYLALFEGHSSHERCTRIIQSTILMIYRETSESEKFLNYEQVLKDKQEQTRNPSYSTATNLCLLVGFRLYPAVKYISSQINMSFVRSRVTNFLEVMELIIRSLSDENDEALLCSYTRSANGETLICVKPNTPGWIH